MLLANAMLHQNIVAIVDDNLGIVEKLQLLHAFSFATGEILLVSVSDVSKHGYRGLYDVAQSEHFARFADAGFEYSHLGVSIQEPDAQRNAHLRVIAAWGTCHHEVATQNLVQPFFHHRLSVAAGDADDRNVELVAVPLG